MSEIMKLTRQIQGRLDQKYSNSQTYFYTNKINEIIKEKRTNVNIFYEDIEYLLDSEENLKRTYQRNEYEHKMFTFKQYYFYHQDCPRIFAKHIEEAYAKWQDKKRDHVYKKLKLVYDQSGSSSASSRMDDQKSQNDLAVSHFLLEISDYNPFSKKYYLRVQAKREKQRKKEVQDKRNASKRDLQYLNHELSAMLNDMSHISEISTISHESPNNTFEQFKNQKFIVRTTNKSQEKNGSSSTNLSSTNSVIKFNFKKQKESAQKMNILKQTHNLRLKQASRQKDSLPQAQRMSPKYNSGNPNIDAQLMKSKSIFSVSSFGILNKQTDLKNINPKREQLKINVQSKKQQAFEEFNSKYASQKKKQGVQPKNLIIKTKSTSKFEPRQSVEKLRVKESSLGKTKANQFSDKKVSNYQNEMRMRSLKSEFVSSSQSKKLFSSTKPSLERMYSNMIVVQKGKRLLELKI